MYKTSVAVVTVMTILALQQLGNIDNPQQNFQSTKKLQIISLDMNFKQFFQKWKNLYHKSYSTQHQQIYRLKVFTSNCHKIYKHNRDKDVYVYTYSLGLNHFSDLTKQQYISLLTTQPTTRKFIYQQHLHNDLISTFKKIKLHDFDNKDQLLKMTLDCTGTITTSPNPPDEVDWSKKAVTPVVNQGQCGSAYAISAVGAVEGLYALRNGKVETFSVQQILECSGEYGNQGCSGGFMDQAFWYIIDHGLATSKSYPLKNNTGKCAYSKPMKATSFTRCADIPSGKYIKLLSSVIQQPTSVAIDADQLQHYSEGIYNGNCSSTKINQAMLVVGYGQEDNQTYWKMKNSFGRQWGEDGYLRLERLEEDGPGKCAIQLVGGIPQGLA